MLDFKLFLINESLNNDLIELDHYLNDLLEKYGYDDLFFWEQFFDKCSLFLKKIGFDNFYGCGRQRCVFSSKDRNVVIKIPNNYIGILSNYNEYENRNNKKHANCRLLVLPKTGIAILLMEKIEEVEFKEKPNWASNYDCSQVGLNKKGEFKAYDYSRF